MTDVYPVAGARPANNDSYLPVLRDSIDQARQRFWASIFIMDARLGTDLQLQVRQIIDALTYACWRGVDVRILLGSSTTQDIATANLTTARVLAARGIPVRCFASQSEGGTHSKYYLTDSDQLVLGSHNWTEEAFCRHINSAMALRSPELAEQLAQKFLRHWERSSEVAADA